MENDFFVVGIDASVGDESALYDLFANIPDQINAAFVIARHQKRDHQSQMKFLLSRHTRYPIYLIRDGEEIKPASVYIIPENTIATISEERLHLKDQVSNADQNSIDELFTSLARNMKKRAIGIILSGRDMQGSTGANAIEEHGGIIMVQEPRSSDSDSKPSEVIVADFPDYILPARNMGIQLNDYIISQQNKN
jgi:two-component system CheB/CheR fusion protein